MGGSSQGGMAKAPQQNGMQNGGAQAAMGGPVSNFGPTMGQQPGAQSPGNLGPAPNGMGNANPMQQPQQQQMAGIGQQMNAAANPGLGGGQQPQLQQLLQQLGRQQQQPQMGFGSQMRQNWF